MFVSTNHIMLLSLSNISIFDDFVMASPTWTFVVQCSKTDFPLVTCSVRRWNLVSMCLFFRCAIRCLIKLMEDLLLTINITTSSSLILSSSIRESNQAAWHALLILFSNTRQLVPCLRNNILQCFFCHLYLYTYMHPSNQSSLHSYHISRYSLCC